MDVIVRGSQFTHPDLPTSDQPSVLRDGRLARDRASHVHEPSREGIRRRPIDVTFSVVQGIIVPVSSHRRCMSIPAVSEDGDAAGQATKCFGSYKETIVPSQRLTGRLEHLALPRMPKVPIG